MKKEWDLLPKILDGSKTVESRWYKSKIAPWDKVSVGDTLYFKNSGGYVTLKALVTKAEQYEISDNAYGLALMHNYALEDLGTTILSLPIQNYIRNKKYAIFVHFQNVVNVNPFQIDKRGFGMQCAWLTMPNVFSIIKS